MGEDRLVCLYNVLFASIHAMNTISTLFNYYLAISLTISYLCGCFYVKSGI